MSYKKSKGVGVLIIFILLMLGVTSIFLSKANNSVVLKKSTKTTVALKEAKDALLDYAATYYFRGFNRFGFLPCPSQIGSTEGTSSGNCGSRDVNIMGRFPWKSLGISPPLDNASECLWYGVSAFYKNGTSPSPPSVSTGVRTGMLNEDSNGAFRIYNPNGNLEKGSNPQDRVVAVVLAPKQILNGQTRGTKSANQLCSPDYNAAGFLETYSGVSNTAVSNTVAAVDDFIRGSYITKDSLNDRLITITRNEIFNRIVQSKTFKSIRDTTLAGLSQCLVDYMNTGADKSLPWPAPLQLADYKSDTNYDDTSSALNLAFGRFPFVVNNSLADSGKSIVDTAMDTNNIVDLLDNCTLKDETSKERLFWKHWKDHFYYALGKKFKPNLSTASTTCNGGVDCLTVNGAGSYSAIVLFSGSRLTGLSQIRNGAIPATDTDTKQTISNYLEGRNANNPNDTTGTLDYESQTSESSTFNDKLWCIDSTTGTPTGC